MGKPIKLFIDFLGRFYTIEEFKKPYNLYNTEGAHLRKIKRFKEAISAYGKEIEIDEEDRWQYYNISLTYFQMGDNTKGFDELKKAIDISKKREWKEEASIAFEENCQFFLESLSSLILKDIILKEYQICKDNDFLEPFTNGYGKALLTLFDKREKLELRRFQIIAEMNDELFSDEELLTVSTNLFKIGVRFLEKMDKKVLLELPKEERELLLKILGEQIP